MSSTRHEPLQLAQERHGGVLRERAELAEAQMEQHVRRDESVAYWQGQAAAYEHIATLYRQALNNLRSMPD